MSGNTFKFKPGTFWCFTKAQGNLVPPPKKKNNNNKTTKKQWQTVYQRIKSFILDGI